MHAGRMSCEDEGKDWGDPSTSQGLPKIASKPLEASRGAWDRFSLTTLKRNQPCQHLDFSNRTVRQKFLLFKACSLCYFVTYCSPRKLRSKINNEGVFPRSMDSFHYFPCFMCYNNSHSSIAFITVAHLSFLFREIA